MKDIRQRQIDQINKKTLIQVETVNDTALECLDYRLKELIGWAQSALKHVDTYVNNENLRRAASGRNWRSAGGNTVKMRRQNALSEIIGHIEEVQQAGSRAMGEAMTLRTILSLTEI